jgi:WD40 repeat protein
VTTGSSPLAQARYAARIRKIVEEVMARRASGETVPDSEVVGLHTDLMPELARELGVLAMLERARAGARSRGDSGGAAPAMSPDAFEGYRLVREAHRGGQGVVYEATQVSTGRRVAIKVMREGIFGDGRDTARFEREVRILGQLEYPGIVGILGSGVHAGHFYYVMDYVAGAPLDQYGVGRPVDERLRAFLKVCEAVSEAHVRGIIHRDLKPANILVDEHGQPRILDFGLARITAEWAASQKMTMTGQFLGSMPWASPEQAAGDPTRIDVRTDVYSLGVVLYQLLTGRFPYRVEGGVRDVLDQIMTAEPSRPRSVSRGIDEDLEAIVLKCLAKERERRYQSAAELAEDIRRHLDRRPVLARPPSAIYQIRAFARRNRALVVGAGAVLATLVLGLIGTTTGMVAASAGRRAAEAAKDRATRSENMARERLGESQRQAYIASIAAADSALRSLDAGAARARLAAAPEELRGWEWSYLNARADRSLLTLPEPAFDVLASPRGDHLAVVYRDGTLALLDATTLEPAWRVTTPVRQRHESPWRAGFGAFTPDGRFLATYDGPQAFVWDAATGRLLADFEYTNAEWGHMRLALSPDGKQLAANGVVAQMIVWDVETRKVLFKPNDLASSGVSYCPTGRVLAIGTARGVVILDAETFATVRTVKPDDWSESDWGAVQFSPDGSELAAVTGFSAVAIGWEEGRVLRRFEGPTQRVNALLYSADGAHLLAASWDRSVRVWNAATGRPEQVLVGHGAEVWGASMVRRGGQDAIVSCAGDGQIKVWAGAPEDAVRRIRQGTVWDVAFIDGDRVFSSSTSAHEIWDARSGDVAETPIRETEQLSIHAIAACPGGRHLAYGTNKGTVGLWDLAGARPVWRRPGSGQLIRVLTVSVDGTMLAVTDAEGRTRILAAADGSERLRFQGSGDAGSVSMVLPASGCVAVPLREAGLGFVDLATGREDRVLLEGLPATASALTMTVSSDGSRLATGHDGGVVVLWDTATRRPIRRMTGMNPAVWSVAFSPDGRRLATGSQDRLVRLWDPQTGDELLTLRGHAGTVCALAWSDDGRRLASGSHDGTVMLWDATSNTRAR